MKKSADSRHPFLKFLVIVFIIAVPIFILAGSNAIPAFQPLLLIIASYVPALAAVVITKMPEERPSFRQRIARWKIDWSWYFLGIILPMLTWFAAALTAYFISGPIQYLAGNAFLLPVIFISNFGEEIGWRGYALPHLLNKHNPLRSSLYLGLIWVIFHAPLYWQRPLEGLVFLAPILPISIILTWFFIGTNGSVLACTLFHAVFNTGSLILLSGEDTQLILGAETILLVIVAIYLVMRNGKGLTKSVSSMGIGIG